jgi:hypothetical protein
MGEARAFRRVLLRPKLETELLFGEYNTKVRILVGLAAAAAATRNMTTAAVRGNIAYPTRRQGFVGESFPPCTIIMEDMRCDDKVKELLL